MRKPVQLFFLTCLIVAGSVALATADQPAKIQALLITGDDVAPYHDWRENSEATREVLVSSGKFDVRVCEEAGILDSANALEAYDVIVFLLFNKSLPMISDAGKKNLLAFVEGGKGFYVQHLASASYKEWEEFGELCGRHWVMGTSGHGPRSVFECNITKVDHPITKGMKDFKIFDELYAKLQGDAPIEVLVSAESDWSNQTEPMVFTRIYGKGRCVHNALGHDRKAIMDSDCLTLIVRGVEWAATGKVTSQ
jgi:type 1 glutamine amidotransferase